MPVNAFLFALGAAATHALWNVLLAGRQRPQAATTAALVCGLVAFAPAVVLTWRFTTAALPWLGASIALEIVYFALLTVAYQRFELSLVYPVARGLAPVLVLLIGTSFLGVGASALQVVGVVVVSSGILLVRRRGKGQLAGTVFGMLISLCIVGFTLVDREGIRHAATIPFFWLAVLPPALIGVALSRRALLPEFDRRTATAGLAMFTGYALYLLALKVSPPHAAQATRESSIVMTTILAAVVLKEPVSRRRAAGVAVVLGGVVLIAVS